MNNGSRATFFAVHINPYYTASEDFHLYAVRAKRVRERGWTDSLLWTNEEAKASYAAPLQVAIMMLAVATDGQPLPYAVFICGVLIVSWSILYVAAFKWLPRTVSPITPLIAVLVSVLFESVQYLNQPGSEYGQWPPHRGLRMATFAWSTPLAMAAVIAAISLIFERRWQCGRLGAIGLLLVALALGDTWAFILATGCMCVVGAILAGMLLGSVWQTIERRPVIISGVALAMLVAAALGMQQLTTGFSGDALARAGFGERWAASPIGAHASAGLRRLARQDLIWLFVLAVGSCVYVTLNLGRARGSLVCRLICHWPTLSRRHLWCLAAVPTIAVLLVVAALARYGMEGYHAYQFIWRRDFLILFASIVFTVEVVKRLFRRVALDRRRSVYLEVGGAVALLAALLAYHNVRIHKFMTRNAVYEYFLTDDLEHLGDWLRERDKTLGDYTLATASHELNYLCAYWTHADLLLPEGFPYHDAVPDTTIESRLVQLLTVYAATPATWMDFNLQRHPSDQWIWARSRLTSARYGFLYYLLHRGLLIEGPLADVLPPTSHGVTRRMADSRSTAEANYDGRLYESHRRGEELVKQIAAGLASNGDMMPAKRPDIIIIDEVSRAFGTPSLDGYSREFRHGEIEAWVLRNKQPKAADAP